MAIEQTDLDLIAAIFRNVGFIVLYIFVGFGPGFLVGILIANRIWGRGNPTYMQTHEDNETKAQTHNKQWHPSGERWQK